MPNSNFMSEANATAIFTAYATAIKLGLKAWIGTTAEWNQLTDDQKKQYQVNFKTDDCSGESIEAVKKSIADDFSINVNYDKGEYCYHLGDLYKFTSAHTAGAWSSADVEQVQVGDELSELKNALNSGLSSLATVATSGNYNDLINKPSIPSIRVESYTSDSQSGVTGVFYISAPSLSGYSLLAHWVLGATSNDGSSLLYNVYEQNTATTPIALYWYSKNGNSLYGVTVKSCALFVKN